MLQIRQCLVDNKYKHKNNSAFVATATNKWLADSGTSVHMIHDRNAFSMFEIPSLKWQTWLQEILELNIWQ